jgi:hypothetical protein
VHERSRSHRNLEGEEVAIENREDRAAAEREVADRHADPEREPHHDLNNPATDPDPTEYPDPYEQRLDPRDPGAVDTPASPADPGAGERPEGPSQGPSTSEPRPPRNVETARRDGFDPEP